MVVISYILLNLSPFCKSGELCIQKCSTLYRDQKDLQVVWVARVWVVLK